MANAKEMMLLIPAPGYGHLSSTVDLARMLNRRSNKLFSITFLIIKSPFGNEGGLVNKLSSSNPDINFVDIPLSDWAGQFSSGLPGKLLIQYADSHKQNVTEVVKKLVSKGDRVLFIVDGFCSSMVDVANQLHARCYAYFAKDAAFLGLCRFLIDRKELVVGSEQEQDWLVPSYAAPVPTGVLPPFVSKEKYAAYSNNFKRLAEMKGIIVNTFAELEPHALRSFLDVEGVPPMYPVGPLGDLGRINRVSETNEAERTQILSWLDEKDNESVIFINFGREGCFEADQVKEIALGLELSGVKFLWSLSKKVSPAEKADMDDISGILPEGFLSRIERRGMICGWAPQTEILAHPAIGGFVTHCGWKSILESLWFGVPIAAWPIYHGQQMTAFYLVNDLKMSVVVKMDYKINQKEVVHANVIQTAIKCLMGMEGSDRELRRRVAEMSKVIKTVCSEGGSSFHTQDRLILDMLGPRLEQNSKSSTILEELIETKSPT